ncbi:MAG: pectin acetylesterase-family hydrolase [Ilumatobacteraceae bacterium]
MASSRSGVREADPERVLLFFQGGGACFSAETCAFDADLPADHRRRRRPVRATGVFGLDDERNPFRDHSVFVPYCTGDVHLGDAPRPTTATAWWCSCREPSTVAAVAELVDRFPDATEVVVAGESAGDRDRCTPNRRPTTCRACTADRACREGVSRRAGGEHVDRCTVGGRAAIPDWPVNDGLTAAVEHCTNRLRAGRSAPRHRLRPARPCAYDRVQTFVRALSGLGVADCV